MSGPKINTALLVASGIEPPLARMFSEPLRAACALYGIDTKVRVASFLAQAMHESVNFTKLEENLFYRSAQRILEVFPSRVSTLEVAMQFVGKPQDLANLVYSGKLGNGSKLSGDGWKYRGRGLFQLTGKANYSAAAEATGRPYVEVPELVAEPSDAALAAAWFWAERDCNRLADEGNQTLITERVNGKAKLGLKERLANYYDVLQAIA